MGLFGTYVHELSNDGLLAELRRRTLSAGQLDSLHYICNELEERLPRQDVSLPKDFGEWSMVDRVRFVHDLNTAQIERLSETVASRLRGKVPDKDINKAMTPSGYDAIKKSRPVTSRHILYRLLVLSGIDMPL